MKIPIPILALFLLWPLKAQDRGPQAISLYGKPIEKFESHGENALSSILRFGIENKVPLHIIRSEDRLCTVKIELTVQEEPATTVIDSIVKQISGYRWTIKDGLLSVEPQSVSRSTEQLLATEIPEFRSGPISTQGLEALLWMFTNHVVKPQRGEGYGFSILGNTDDPLVSVPEMYNATVEEILNHVITEGAGGAWILLPIPDDYQKSADRHFVKIISYSDKHAGQNISCGDSSSTIKP